MIGWIRPVDFRLAASSAREAGSNSRRGWWGFGVISSTGISRASTPGRKAEGVGGAEGYDSPARAVADGGAGSSTSTGSSETEIRLVSPRPRRGLAGLLDMG